MRKQGNGDVYVCVNNLLATNRYEVPFERLKGRDGKLVDKPGRAAVDDMIADAEWLIETYEPRATVVDIDAEMNAESGDIMLLPEIEIEEEDE